MTCLGFELSADALRRAAMQLGPHDAPLGLPASEFVTFEELGALVYSKTALLFTTIANVYGEAELDDGAARYAERYRFRHPRPDDLLHVLRETLGAAAANIGAVIMEGHGVNYVARDLRTARLTEPRGLPPASSRWPTPPAGAFESRVNVYREGELQLPVEILLITATGEQITKRWNGEGRVEIVSHTGQSPIVSAVVDPQSAGPDRGELARQRRPHAPAAPAQHAGPRSVLVSSCCSAGSRHERGRSARSHRGARPSPELVRAIGASYAYRLGAAWLLALPMVQLVRASGILQFPEGDSKLFDAGGLYLLEVLPRHHALLLANLSSAAWLLLFFSFGALIPNGWCSAR